MGNKPWPLLNYGFRCFFLLAGIWAVLAMALWLWVLRGGTWLGPDPLLWHGHEMLIGFVGAAIAGFLLTAAPAWTNQPPPQGVPLGVLALTWLLGRTAMALGGVLPALWVLLLDVLFPVLLVGLVAKNSILLIDLTNQRRVEGLTAREALLEACPQRLRPVLMTSLTIVLALLPAALGFGAGADTNGPLAVAVIGGMVSSTLLTLVVVPAVYSLVAGGLSRASLRALPGKVL